MDNASLGSQGGDAEAVHCPPVLKITQCVLIRLENFLFYLILQGLPKFAFGPVLTGFDAYSHTEL